MKTLMISATLLFSCLWLSAAVITVDNSANSGGQYTNLQLAADNAAAGDTLHVIGSNASYGNVIIEKALTLIGAGYNPPNQFGLKSEINSLSIGAATSLASATGTRIMGCKIANVSWSGSAAHNDITIERCEIANVTMSGIGASGWVLQNNILTNLYIANNANLLIRNNIFKGTINTSDEPSVLISNNLFLSTSSSGSVFSAIQFATITNNIFYQGRDPLGCQFSTFNNNLTYNTPNNALPYGNNSGAGNFVNVNPQFASVTAGSFNFAFDYRLQATSPGKNAGTDGTDIGIYGSIYSFPIGGPSPHLTSPMPRVPQVLEVNIQNASIFQGTPLQVQVRARKQN
jgi:hypothetical protein